MPCCSRYAFDAKSAMGQRARRRATRSGFSGADLAIDYREEDVVAEAKRFTDGRGVDVILDIVAGDYVARNYDAYGLDIAITHIRGQGGHHP